jgi:predicted CoA-binding protein
MKADLTQINRFLASKSLAFVGVSRDSKKFGTQVFGHLHQLGYILHPVHPEADVINGIRCVKSIEDLPADVKSICLLTHKQDTDAMIEQSIKMGINQIWVQQLSETPQTKKFILESPETNIVTGRCLFMYSNPSGMHNFHRKLSKLFGTIAK